MKSSGQWTALQQYHVLPGTYKNRVIFRNTGGCGVRTIHSGAHRGGPRRRQTLLRTKYSISSLVRNLESDVRLTSLPYPGGARFWMLAFWQVFLWTASERLGYTNFLDFVFYYSKLDFSSLFSYDRPDMLRTLPVTMYPFFSFNFDCYICLPSDNVYRTNIFSIPTSINESKIRQCCSSTLSPPAPPHSTVSSIRIQYNARSNNYEPTNKSNSIFF